MSVQFGLAFLAPRRGAIASVNSESNPLQAYFSYLFYVFQMLVLHKTIDVWKRRKELEQLDLICGDRTKLAQTVNVEISHTNISVCCPARSSLMHSGWRTQTTGCLMSLNKQEQRRFNLNYRSIKATWVLTLSLPLFYFCWGCGMFSMFLLKNLWNPGSALLPTLPVLSFWRQHSWYGWLQQAVHVHCNNNS